MMGTNGLQRWAEIRVEADRDSVDDLVRLFGKHCTGGAVVEEMDPNAQPPAERVIVKGFVPEWNVGVQRTLEIALLLLGQTAPLSEPRTMILEPEDWAESWKKGYTPQHIGRHTVIVPTWHDYVPRAGEVIVRLDPGMAFGTGLHATTRLCLVAVERLGVAGQRVLDVGTGSGILSIAAALQGAAAVLALDVDPLAIGVARANTALNGVDDRVTVEEGTLSPDHPGPVGEYDLVLANILAEVIIDMASPLAAALRPGGRLVTSGILVQRAEDVWRSLADQGLDLVERLVEGEWAALIVRQP